ncbi:inner membrane protein YhjD [Gordonia rubripertincta]|uniref:Inner membrane protein YhjD n=1 Tax=Gordonia rubripertincta TaxID=36822 RepID=A0ABT4N0J2_GORRU|nr:inner membrane protein YhjD [Gordonia rubripertincta]MCZ4552783.1 inner membrane protein YhjD [Gordonia rubripertincta]
MSPARHPRIGGRDSTNVDTKAPERKYTPATEDNAEKPSFLDKQRAARPWLDHLVEAGQRYQGSKGDYFAAGTTYFSIFALFPLLMIGFAVAGFVFVNNPDLLDRAKEKIAESVDGSMGDQLTDLMNQAIDSRTTIGVIGLVVALYAGLGWMANLRMALTVQWGDEPESDGVVKTKLADLAALLGLFAAMVVTFALSALSSSGLTAKILEWLQLDELPGVFIAIRAVSIVLSIFASWLLFTWVIAKLPRIALPLRNAAKAGLLTAVVFEIFKFVASFYLQSVITGPAGATFGPILGIMVFAFITTRIILFATAWAATDPRNRKYEPASIPEPVVIDPRVQVREGLGPRGVAAAIGTGVVAAVGISAALTRRRS